jgi:hypothetical protein
MNRAVSASDRLAAGFGLLLAVVALLMQLAAGTFVMPPMTQDSFDQALASSICHADFGSSDPAAPVPHHMPDCAVCPFCQALGHAHVLLAPSVAVVAAPVLWIVHAIGPMAAHALPRRAGIVASARGPPTQQ